MDRIKLQQAMENRLKKGRQAETSQQSNTAPEANLSKIISELNSDDEEIEQNSGFQESFNDSYLKSKSNQKSFIPQPSTQQFSQLDLGSPYQSLSLENKYDSNYPSIDEKSNLLSNKSNSSNLEQQLSDLEHVYNQITPRIPKQNSLALTKDLEYEAFNINEPSLLHDPNSISKIVPKQTNQPIVQMYQNLPSKKQTPPKPQKQQYTNLQPTHSDNSFQQQETLIKNLQQECDRLQLVQPKPDHQNDQVLTNLRHQVNQFQFENNSQKQLIDRINQELIQVGKENQKMKKIFAEIISDLYGENAEVDANRMQFDVLNIIKQSKTQNNAIYIEKLNEAIVDLSAMRILVDEKEKEISQLKADNQQQQQNNINNKPTINNNSSLIKEVEKRDQQISKQLTEINELRTRLMQYSPQSSDENELLKQQIQQLEQMRILDKTRIKTMEKEHFDQKIREDEFNDQRIGQIRQDYEKQIQDLKLQNRNIETQYSHEKSLNSELRQEISILKTNSSDDKLDQISRRLEAADKPLAYSNQMIERAVIAERKLREETEKYERILLDKEQKLSSYEIELDSLIQELEVLV